MPQSYLTGKVNNHLIESIVSLAIGEPSKAKFYPSTIRWFYSSVGSLTSASPEEIDNVRILIASLCLEVEDIEQDLYFKAFLFKKKWLGKVGEKDYDAAIKSALLLDIRDYLRSLIAHNLRPPYKEDIEEEKYDNNLHKHPLEFNWLSPVVRYIIWKRLVEDKSLEEVSKLICMNKDKLRKILRSI
jgi:hypothetical protein